MTIPTGPAVAFLFSDVEGSTRLERAVGSNQWSALIARHDELLRTAIESTGGAVVKTEGDSFFAAFETAIGAISSAVSAQRAIASEPWLDDLDLRVRMGIHLGEGRLRAGIGPGDREDYVGIDVNYAARIAAAANGGQIVLSDALVGALPRDLTRVAGMADVELVSDGPRTVKDFDEPQPLYRLVVPGVADDPRPLRTTEIRSNLPADVTTFVGRQADIDALRDDLAESRIVTLTGPGGSGKTRLALAAGRAVQSGYPHGIWFVDLAAVRDATLLESAIAATLDVRESPDRPVEVVLQDHLRDRTMLLILDNLEQLLPDAAVVVARLVRAAPGLRVLVTSRELLRITGERGHAVPPLDVDTGVALFVDRARAHRPDLAMNAETLDAIRAICERLGGLPLALELAAARIRVLSPALVLERLGHSLDLGGGARDLPERQRTLRGAIAWSFELLTPEERRLFVRLAVFADGWTVETAWPVVDVGGDLGIDLVSGLESLADKSLVRIEPGSLDDRSTGDETRFSLHPLLREFALEQLDESGERPGTEVRFAEVCVGIAETVGQAILGPTGEAGMRRLDREDRNIRAAIDWSIRSDRNDLGLRVIGAIWRWFQQRGRLREGRAMLAELLAHPTEVDARIRISGLAAEGGLAYWMNDFAGARAAYAARLDLAIATGDPILTADAHYDIGFLSMVEEDEEALRLHEQQALDLYLAAGREDAAVRARQALVLAVFLAGENETARELETQNLEVFRRTGSLFQIADSTTLLSAIDWRVGDIGASWTQATDALGFFSGIDSASGVARALGMTSIILLTHGDAELGAIVGGAVYRLVREQGVMLAPVKVLHLPDPEHLAIERFGTERTAELLAKGEAMPLAEVVATILALPAPTG